MKAPYNPLAAFIADHGFTPTLNPNGSISFPIPWLHRDGTEGATVSTVRTHWEARRALGY